MSERSVYFAPSDWKQATLGQLCECILGGTPSTDVPMYWGGSVPWMASGDVHLRRIYDVPGRITQKGLKASNATLVSPPAVAVALAGQGKTRGTAALALCTLSTNQSIALLRANGEDLQTEYLFHNFDRRYEELRARSSGGGRGGLTRAILEAVPIDLPPLNEQEKITEILDALDTVIQETTAIVGKLKAAKQGLLHDLLTRGLGTNGELRPTWRQAPHLYKQSVVGCIPKHWDVVGVLEVASDKRQPILTGPFGAQLGQADFVAEGVPVLRIGNVQAGYIDWSDALFVSRAKAACLERFIVCEGDLLFARQGATTGRNALADAKSHGALINYHIIRVAVDHDKCDPHYLFAAFNSAQSKSSVDQEKGRGTREGINSEQIAALRFALPPIGEQRLLAARIKEAQQAIENEIALVEKLRLQKSGLMDDLLTGRVRVTPLLNPQVAA